MATTSDSFAFETLPTDTATVIAFDFEQKRDTPISLQDVAVALLDGKFVWIDLMASSRELVRKVLRELSELEESVIVAMEGDEAVTQHARFEHALHVSICAFRRAGCLDLERVDLVLSERMLISARRGPVEFLDVLRKNYRLDFQSFAKTPSFLLYEIWDHLCDSYLSVQKVLEERVERVQQELRAPEVSADVFGKVSELSADLLRMRKVVLPARSVLSDLATRRSLFVSEVTQRYMSNLIGPLEHILGDLLVDAELLSESLNLYMSLVAHRTNEVMKRLTAVSVVFMPLTFIVGVYGMNFEVFPELRWHYGYAYFWLLVLALVFGLVVMMRRVRLI